VERRGLWVKRAEIKIKHAELFTAHHPI